MAYITNTVLHFFVLKHFIAYPFPFVLKLFFFKVFFIYLSPVFAQLVKFQVAIELNRIFPWTAMARTNPLNVSRAGDPNIKLGCLSMSYLCMRF